MSAPLNPREPADRQSLEEGNAWLEALMYRIRLWPRDGELVGGAAFDATLGAYSVIALPNAGTPGFKTDLVLPAGFWLSGAARVRLLWSGDTASTNTVDWQANFTATAPGGVPATVTGTASSHAGPASIGAQLDTEIVSACPVNGGHTLLTVHLFRSAADAYAGAVRLYAAEVIFRPDR